jgi:hypothetical protein
MYSITAFDVDGSKSSERDELERIYRKKIEEILGGPEGVVKAYLLQQEVFDKYEESPLPESASQEEKAAIDRWEAADSAASEAAFKKWSQGVPSGARFEIFVAKNFVSKAERR